MMEPKDIQEEYATALRALLEKNTIARRRNLWGVFSRVTARAEAAEAEVARLTADVKAANHDATRLVYELARLGIEYDGDDPLARLVEEVAALRANADPSYKQRYDLAWKSLRAVSAEIAALRAQLDAAGWREMGGDPPDGAIQIRTMAEVIQLDPSEDFEVFGIDEGAFICEWSAGNGWQWRPAPPQE